MTTEKEKAILGAATFQAFFEQFGNDEHAKLVIECLLEELMNAKTIPVSSESKQTGNQAGNDSQK